MIVSRKITRFVTSHYSREKFDIIGSADLFVDSSKIFMQNYTDENIYDTDQSGFNREIHSGRTLEFRGLSAVEGVVQSISATKHSYTIQPTISKDGKLLPPPLSFYKSQKVNSAPEFNRDYFRHRILM
jgi:hypothetical protein